MDKVSADQLGTLLTLGAAAVGSLLVIVVNCIHGSKCKKIRCCGFECEREIPIDPPAESEPEPEPEPEPNP